MRILTVYFLSALLCFGQFSTSTVVIPEPAGGGPDPLFSANADVDSFDFTGSDGSGVCTLTGATTTDTGGGNFAVDFNASGDDAACGSGLDNLANFTVLVWIQKDSAGADFSYFMGKTDDGAASQSWMLRIVNSANRFDVLLFQSNGTSVGDQFNSGAIITTDGTTWHHLGATFTDCGTLDSCDVELFLDGSPTATSQGTNNTGALADDSAFEVFFGDQGDNSSNDFNGRVDDARVYSGVLTDAEIADIFNAGRQ